VARGLRRLKAARFPTAKTLESFDFAAHPEYTEKRENLIVAGNPGTDRDRLWSQQNGRF